MEEIITCIDAFQNQCGILIRNRRENYKRISRNLIILKVLKNKRFKLSYSLFLEILRCIQHKDITRSCRRFERNNCNWWNHVWTNYTDTQFKQNFRVSKGTFLYIVNSTRCFLVKDSLVEEPIYPDMRVAITLYRLGRGDYIHTIAELFGVGDSTVCEIVIEVCGVIVNQLWDSVVYFPKTKEEFQKCMEGFERLWQFPYCFGAIDGCHLPIKCPPGGQESAKEYHNFKIFYSIVLMAIVGSDYQFLWASCGIPGNTHDSSIFQASYLYKRITEDDIIPQIGNFENEKPVYPMMVGDSAFPFRPWLLKPYTNANLEQKQRYFNYRLSRARMVTEGTYGQLKGRFRLLMRKCESKKDNLKIQALACLWLHNLCIQLQDSTPRAWDVSSDRQRTQDEIREILNMRNCRKTKDNSKEAALLRDMLKDKFWEEKETTNN